MINDTEGVYTRTQAFNFLKDLLGIPKKALISEKFFVLFFIEDSDRFFFIRKPEEIIKRVFTENGISELNKMYYKKKMEQKNDEAKEIFEKVTQVVKKSLAA